MSSIYSPAAACDLADSIELPAKGAVCSCAHVARFGCLVIPWGPMAVHEGDALGSRGDARVGKELVAISVH